MSADLLSLQAGNFLTAYANLCILHSQSSNSTFMVPMIVNGAFTAELALKAILAKCEINYGREHNLVYLFLLLPIEYSWDIVNRSMAATPAFRDLKRWLDELFLISNAFEEWRYSYEATHSLVLDTGFLQAFVQATYHTLYAHFGGLKAADYEEVEPGKTNDQLQQKYLVWRDEQKQVAYEKLTKIFQKRGMPTGTLKESDI